MLLFSEVIFVYLENPKRIYRPTIGIDKYSMSLDTRSMFKYYLYFYTPATKINK